MEPGGLGRVLSDLLQPDNALIQQATAQLREAFRHPEVLPQLCQLLAGAPDPQIRQLAAVLLRRRLTKHWRKLNPEEQDRWVLGREGHQVSVALAQLAALLLRHQGLERWPQLLQWGGSDPQGLPPPQISLLVLSSALESDPEAFTPHYTALLRLFHSALGQRGQPGALYYSLRGLAAMAAGLGSDHLNLMRSLVPKIISAVRQLIPVNEVHASEAMEVFDELMESEVLVIVQHLSDVVGFCLEVASNRALGDALRVKALSTLSFLIKLRGKAVLKQRLLPPVLDALFPILSAEPPPGQLDAEDQEGEDEGDEAQTPKHVAAQVIDMLALHLPPEKLFPQLMPHLEPALRSPHPYQRKAGLMVVAVLAEGCGDHIRTRHLQPLLGVICQSLADESLVVRSAALFALGQFSENLQPDITAYVGEVLPLLLSYLGGVELARGGHLAKAYYALENFVESLGAGIEPFLPVLMEQTLGTLRAPGGPRPKELAISALGAIAPHQSLALPPPPPRGSAPCSAWLWVNAPPRPRCLTLPSPAETLGVLVRALGREVVGPLAEESCQLGLGLAEGQDDPDLRRCTYSLFAALSCAMGDDLAPHLPRITTLLLYSLKSTEGLVPPAGDTSSFLLFEDEEEEAEVEGEEDLDGEDDDEEEEELFGLSVESAYVDEKEDACAALGEIAVNASVAFLPYLESCVPEVFQLLEFPHLGVRKAAYEALGQFCIALHRVCERDPSEPHAAALQRLLGLALPAMARGVHRERERLVAMAVLEALGAVLTACRQEALRNPGRLAELCGALRAVLERKVLAGGGDTDWAHPRSPQAEYDAMLLEYAGEGIPALAMAAGGDAFAPYFAGFLPLLLNKMKPSCSVAEPPFVPRLLPPFLGAARDSDPEVRSNGVFALGVLAEHGGEALHYPKILALLAGGSAQEPSARVRDNVCGAVARMVLSQPQALPLRCLSHLTPWLPPDAQVSLLSLLRHLSAHCPTEFQAALLALPPDASARISGALGSA
uniref:Importin 4 n=1 Tax=Chrysemys picta bellii TaxID=8478 RepID=A0A8C3ITC4_CHRPI